MGWSNIVMWELLFNEKFPFLYTDATFSTRRSIVYIEGWGSLLLSYMAGEKRHVMKKYFYLGGREGQVEASEVEILQEVKNNSSFQGHTDPYLRNVPDFVNSYSHNPTKSHFYEYPNSIQIAYNGHSSRL